MEHSGLFFLFTCQPTKGCNCSGSGVNVCSHLLRNNFSRNFSSIRSGPKLCDYDTKTFRFLMRIGPFLQVAKKVTKYSSRCVVVMCFPGVSFCFLTHLSQMDLPSVIRRKGPFSNIGVLRGIFHFYSNFDRTFCKHTVETLIRRRILRRLICVCTVCQCPTKGRYAFMG